MEQFWAFRPFGEHYFGTRFAYAEPVGKEVIGQMSDRPACPVCGRGLGMRPWYPPHRIRLTKAAYPDVLWAGGDIFLSGRLKSLYEDAGLVGITRYDPPAEIVQVGRKREGFPTPPDYHYIWHVYDGADLDDERSGARRPHGLCRKCRGGIEALERIVFKEGSWTGADIFEAYGLPGTELISERFKNLIDKYGITGVTLIPAERYRFDSRRFPSRY